MSEQNVNQQSSWRRRLSEDWLAVSLGLLLVALVYWGLLPHVPW